MPKGVYKRTEYHKQFYFQKGHISFWNNDRKFSIEHRRKIGEANRRRIISISTRKKLSIAAKNRNNNRQNAFGYRKPINLRKQITTKGYVYIYNPNHPRASSSGYVHRSHLAMEKHIGRYLTPKEVVHHINGIKNDDRPENLKLFTNTSSHTKFHHILTKKDGNTR
jgi:hypothetical protein